MSGPEFNPRDDEPINREEYDKAMDMIARRCQHVSKTPVYITHIGGVLIDRSEWENENGAFLRYDLKTCPYIADEGKMFCPRHELEAELAEKPANVG